MLRILLPQLPKCWVTGVDCHTVGINNVSYALLWVANSGTAQTNRTVQKVLCAMTPRVVCMELLLSVLYRGGSWGSERERDQPEVTQQSFIGNRNGTRPPGLKAFGHVLCPSSTSDVPPTATPRAFAPESALGVDGARQAPAPALLIRQSSGVPGVSHCLSPCQSSQLPWRK